VILKSVPKSLDSSLTNSSLAEALELLQSYSCKTPKLITSEAEKTKVQAALLLVASLTDHQNLGICATDVPTGLAALANYAHALGYKFQPQAEDQTAEISPVYIKFNAQKQSYYLDAYPGDYRGVLISCQSSEHESLNATFGHFPLDLF
jgi:hypothetical protein